MQAHSVADAVSRLWARLSLVARVMLSASLALIVAGTLLLWVSTGKDADFSRSQIEEHLVAELESLSTAVTESAVLGDYANIEQILRQRVKRSDIRRVAWTSARGKMLEAVDKGAAPHAPTWFVRSFGIPPLRDISALSIGGRGYGQITIEMTATPVHNRLWEAFLGHLAILTLAVGLDFAGILLILRNGLRPLTALDQGACALEQGDLSVRIPLQGSPELQHSIMAFNRMAESLQKLLEEQKQAEERLLRLNETLEQRVGDEVAKNMAQERLLIQQSRLAALGEMIHNIAHHWRQPINALNLLLGNIMDAYHYKELDDAYIADATATGNRLIQQLSATIDNFRNYFRPDQEKTRFRVEDAANAALNILGVSLEHRQIEIIFSPGEAGEVEAYLNEFTEVILNILNNARNAILNKHIPQGKITLTAGRDDTHAWLKILDNGGGIPAIALPKIFDPYFTTREQGTGLGLYMSKMLMTHMNGDINIRNIEGGVEALLTLALAHPVD